MTIVEEALARRNTGVRIAQLRSARGLSQRALAAQAGLSQGHIGNIERGHSRVTDESRHAIAKALGVTADELEQAS